MDDEERFGEDSGASDHGARASRFPRWTPYALAGVVALVVLAVVLVPRLMSTDPFESLGEEGSPARTVAAALDDEMTCSAGEIGSDRSVLACYEQAPDHVLIVFLQADRQGRIASYTTETQSLEGSGHSHSHTGVEDAGTGEEIEIANRIAAIATPGTDFTGCSHNYSTPYFCFDSLASWKSADVVPVESTGAKDRLPTVDELGAALNEHGWDCQFGMCTIGETSLSAVQSRTGLGLQFAAPVDIKHVKQALSELLEQTADTEQLRQWAGRLDGALDIVVADGFVVGYVPQGGEAGMLVVDEVAGVLPGTA